MVSGATAVRVDVIFTTTNIGLLHQNITHIFVMYAAEGLLFTSKHIKGKLSKTEKNVRYRIYVILTARVGTKPPSRFRFILIFVILNAAAIWTGCVGGAVKGLWLCLPLPSQQQERKRLKIKSSMARSLPVENLLPQYVRSIINYLQ